MVPVACLAKISIQDCHRTEGEMVASLANSSSQKPPLKQLVSIQVRHRTEGNYIHLQVNIKTAKELAAIKEHSAGNGSLFRISSVFHYCYLICHTSLFLST